MAEKRTLKEFVKACNEKHGYKFDYSKFNLPKDKNDKTTVICPEHGKFYVNQYNHASGRDNCTLCNKEKKRKEKESQLIEKAKRVHQDRFDYSEVDYRDSQTKVTIICPIHGRFYQHLLTHTNITHGCPKCSLEERAKKRTLTTDEFIKRSRKVHGDRYDYSKVNYEHHDKHVEIICPFHGSFFQPPTCHIEGAGCQVCNSGYYRDNRFFEDGFRGAYQPSTVYLVKMVNPVDGESFLKIGFTRKCVDKRLESKNTGPYEWETIDSIKTTLFNSLLIENSFLSEFSDFKYKPNHYFCGHTECFDKSKGENVKELFNLISSELKHETDDLDINT